MWFLAFRLEMTARRFLKAAERWLRPCGRHAAPRPAAVFLWPAEPSPAEMTVIEAPWRIPPYVSGVRVRGWAG